MFCATCSLANPEPVTERPSDGLIPATELPLVLVATNVASRDSDSFASVVNTASDRGGAFGVGDRLPGAGSIESITLAHVDFHNDQTGRLERLSLRPVASKKEQRPEWRAASSGSSAPEPSNLSAKVDAAVRKTGEHSYEIERSLITSLVSNPMQARGVGRLLPYQRDGKQVGARLFGIRASSPLKKIGLTNGDVLLAVNGIDLSSPDNMLSAYTKLRGESNIELTVERGGNSVALSYSIR